MEVESVDMKKLFPEEKKKQSQKVKEFLDKKGFYVVLVICLVIVAGTALYVTTRSSSISEIGGSMAGQIEGNDIGEALAEGDDVSSAANGEVDPNAGIIKADAAGNSGLAGSTGVLGAAQNADTGDASKASGADSDTAKANDIGKASSINSEGSAAGQASTGAKSAAATGKTASSIAVGSESITKSASGTAVVKENMVMPVFGEVTFEFSKDKLIYSKTLEEWRAHDGLDIAADRGTAVKAAAAGVVSAVKNDPRYGILIVIDHGNGLKTVYANLASDESVSVNQKVEQGEVIGCVGDTAAFLYSKACNRTLVI
jgi:murein DD-endopeptidase MepM/ murein hydrolase activator NlpD